MGLFRPLDESIHDIVNNNAMAKHSNMYHKMLGGSAAGIKKGDGAYLQMQKVKNRTGESPLNKNSKAVMQYKMKQRTTDKNGQSKYASGHVTESTVSLLGLTDEEIWELNEGNCNSDTCKCKGGTCPVSVTDGISTSSYAAKKLANAGSNNKTDMNAVVPNAEYSRRNDALFIGDGDSPETSKTNIPAILAAKTAGGAPHGWTTDNGINGTGSNVFKLRKLRDDDDGPNG